MNYDDRLTLIVAHVYERAGRLFPKRDVEWAATRAFHPDLSLSEWLTRTMSDLWEVIPCQPASRRQES
jgi:hypothetical protein